MSYALKSLENIILTLTKGRLAVQKKDFKVFQTWILHQIAFGNKSYFLLESNTLESLVFGETRSYQHIQTVMMSEPKK